MAERLFQLEQPTNLPTIGSVVESNLGLKAELQELINANKARLAKKSAQIRGKYGDWLTDYEVSQVDRAQRENAICANCTGLPCKKSVHRHFQQVIRIPNENQIVYIVNKPCKFILPMWRQNALKKMFKGAEIPEQYLGLTFDDYTVDAKNKNAVIAAHKLLDELDKGAFFFGNYGTGKTMLAAIIAQEHLRRGRSVLFSKLPDILRNIRATFNKDSKINEVDVLEKIYSVPILILDDVKAVRQRKFAGETLFDIIDARYNAKLQTIMTSNDTLAEVQEALNNPIEGGKSSDGSRIYDRCKQMCYPIKLEGYSRR